jgi:anti-sigma regulatory factor (Ser/Thr protein kinase)
MPYYQCEACRLTSYSAAFYSAATTCPNCSAPLSDRARLHLVPGEHRAVTRTLAVGPASVADARRVSLSLSLPQTTRERLALVVSELVTNAVCHAGLGAGDAIELEIDNGERSVRVAVRTVGPQFSPPSTDELDPLAVHGRGLLIVDAMADSWGVDHDSEGCTVWCELAIEEDAPRPVRLEETLIGFDGGLTIKPPATQSG